MKWECWIMDLFFSSFIFADQLRPVIRYGRKHICITRLNDQSSAQQDSNFCKSFLTPIWSLHVNVMYSTLSFTFRFIFVLSLYFCSSPLTFCNMKVFDVVFQVLYTVTITGRTPSKGSLWLISHVLRSSLISSAIKMFFLWRWFFQSKAGWTTVGILCHFLGWNLSNLTYISGI